jgi:hypothetical protein
MGVSLHLANARYRVGPPSGLGRRPRAATAQCRCVSIHRPPNGPQGCIEGSGTRQPAAGPGGIALKRDLQSVLTRKRNIEISGQYIICKSNYQQETFFTCQLRFVGAPNGWMNLATVGTRPHPGGGMGADRRRIQKQILINRKRMRRKLHPRGIHPPPDYVFF